MADGKRKENNIRLQVDDIDYADRLDLFLTRKLASQSRSTIQKWVQSGLCTVNGKVCKAGEQVKTGDTICLLVPQLKQITPELTPRSIPLDILFEDQDLIVLNKPAGMVVHPGAGTKEPTLVEGVLAYLQAEAGDLPGTAERPGIVHRLDKDTSGAIVVCKNLVAHESLSQQFRDKTNLREYVAILNGYLPEDEKVCESYLVRDERNRMRYKSLSIQEYKHLSESSNDARIFRYAKTTFCRKRTYNQRLTLVTARLSTGRTHQIRVHARSLGLPVWGDQLHGRRHDLPSSFPLTVRTCLQAVNRQVLHARTLGFAHPKTGEQLAFEAPLPLDFRKILEILQE